jgi:hypothetical protein
LNNNNNNNNNKNNNYNKTYNTNHKNEKRVIKRFEIEDEDDEKISKKRIHELRFFLKNVIYML